MSLSANGTAAVPTVRCAIYTRKSTEEGLEQAFNSLEAQRQAAEHALFEAQRVRTAAEHLAAEAFSDDARVQAAQHVATARAVELRAPSCSPSACVPSTNWPAARTLGASWPNESASPNSSSRPPG